MSRRQRVYHQWYWTIQHHLPHLSKLVATVLAMWSLGMILAQASGVKKVAAFLSPILRKSANTLRQRLREFYLDADHKRGAKRRTLEVEPCFPALLRWVLSLWKGSQLALALDATTLSDRLTILAVSVLYRGCAIPVAWTVLRGNRKQPWRDHCLRMFALLQEAVPSSMTVLVLTDRGLFSPELFKKIVSLGWHPLMRIPRLGSFQPQGSKGFVPLREIASRPGVRCRLVGLAFKKRKLPATLLVRWEPGAEEPWLILTNLPPQASDACWYGMRVWIEQGFRLIKRAGWQWHKSQITQPERAARLWLILAVGTLRLMSLAGETDENIPASTVPEVDVAVERFQREVSHRRAVNVFRQGLARLWAAWLGFRRMPVARFVPEPWSEISEMPDHETQLQQLLSPTPA